MSTVTMQELELETAELLPSRETLCMHPCKCFFPVFGVSAAASAAASASAAGGGAAAAASAAAAVAV